MQICGQRDASEEIVDADANVMDTAAELKIILDFEKYRDVKNMKLEIIIILIWTAAVTSGAGYLDGIYDAIDALKAYANDYAPYVKEGIKMATKAERFVDSAIGEECVYECPSIRMRPVARVGHVKTANGCGSFDVIFNDSEDSLVHVEKAFTECCDQHDYCYDTCNEDKDMCDLRFKKCLYANCRKPKKLSFLDTKACKLKAKLFYLTVIGVGCQSFLDAQENACQCVLPAKQEL